VSLSLPPGAPPGAIAASTWEIDEPGYVFCDIYLHLLSGDLDNSNALPASTPDDVSLALGFAVGTLNAGDSIAAVFHVSSNNIDGLKQIDPDSQISLYFDGNVTRGTHTQIPEPGASLLSIGGLIALRLLRRK
jgi:hypothetical protein